MVNRRFMGLLFFVFLLFPLLAGCCKAKQGVEKETSAYGIGMQLHVNQKILSPGDTLKIHGMIVNNSGRELEYTKWNIGDPVFYLELHTPYDTPQFVEEELDYWRNQVGQYCPWSAELIEIEDYR